METEILTDLNRVGEERLCLQYRYSNVHPLCFQVFETVSLPSSQRVSGDSSAPIGDPKPHLLLSCVSEV